MYGFVRGSNPGLYTDDRDMCVVFTSYLPTLAGIEVRHQRFLSYHSQFVIRVAFNSLYAYLLTVTLNKAGFVALTHLHVRPYDLLV